MLIVVTVVLTVLAALVWHAVRPMPGRHRVPELVAEAPTLDTGSMLPDLARDTWPDYGPDQPVDVDEDGEEQPAPTTAVDQTPVAEPVTYPPGRAPVPERVRPMCNPAFAAYLAVVTGAR
ncbi:hypothetical protein ACIBF5_09665 [Micromonospora sp. NPDC050417]|uniref:hypothetical protein n=1 Tax=Micromonospora sp. NPDC050417 TaxID=3364280 RepID=UPI0037B7CD0F